MIDWRGEVDFLEKRLPFEFDGNHLVIHMYNGEAATLLQQEISPGVTARVKNDIPSEIIQGMVFPERKKVIFSVDVKGYGYKSGIDIEKTDIIIFVKKYSLISSGIDREYISIESKQFHKMLGLIPQYKCNSTVQDQIGEITYESSVVKKHVGTFCIGDIECIVNPVPSISWGGSKFDFTPGLQIEAQKDLSVDEWKVYDAFYSLFQFFLMRRNILIDKFVVCHNKEKKELYINVGGIEPELENLQHRFDDGGIPWGIAFKYFNSIFNDFFDGKVYIDFLYKDKKSRFLFSMDTISSDAAAFENIFDKIYSIDDVFKTSKPEAYEKVKSDLEERIKDSSGKEKGIYQSLLKLLKPINLEKKIQFCFNEYVTCFAKLLKETRLREPRQSFDEMARTCASTRNNIDHGNEGTIINQDVMEAFAYLRALIYAMYLRKWGFTDEEIATSLYCLFSVEM